MFDFFKKEISERLAEITSSTFVSPRESFATASSQRPIAVPVSYSKKSVKSRTAPSSKQAISSIEVKKATKSHRYVLINRKRDFSQLTEDGLSKSGSQEESRSINTLEQESRNSGAGSTKDQMNIIDVISAEYAGDEDEQVDSRKDTDDRRYDTPAKKEKITCNGIEMLREKISPGGDAHKHAVNSKTTVSSEKKSAQSEYVYDIYYLKSNEIYLDLLYANNFEIKAFNEVESADLLNDKDSDENEGSKSQSDFKFIQLYILEQVLFAVQTK